MTSQLEKTSGEKASLTTKIEETILYNSVADRELKGVIKNKQVKCFFFINHARFMTCFCSHVHV